MDQGTAGQTVAGQTVAGQSVAVQTVAVQIVALLVAPIHAYEGRPQDGPRPDPEPPGRTSVTVRAGRGLIGDRFSGHAAHRRAAVTVLDADALDEVAAEIGAAGPLDPLLTRRNIVLRGFPVDALAIRRAADGTRTAGAVFSLDSGDGPVRFRAHHPASPCRWMDVQLGPGAWKAMRGRGGVRCEPLDDGVLRLGPAVLRVLDQSADRDSADRDPTDRSADQCAASSQLRP
ncbi:MOSC domain-containing protein [Pseudonocardia lacus]|uniref:MOSC domain-containing protein n=1 Tax=Pseudonocardia lacus TaxID=2835865 RepID=UPI0027E33F45|nr:MOSC domain-containing protein [Pseudonocardia lacus]